MKIAPVAEVKAKFSSYLEQCEESPVIVTKNGRPVAVLIGVHDDDDLEGLVLAHTPKFRQLLQAAERRIAGGQGIGHGEFWETGTENPPRAKSK
jgi:prevent-host-death family protein